MSSPPLARKMSGQPWKSLPLNLEQTTKQEIRVFWASPWRQHCSNRMTTWSLCFDDGLRWDTDAAVVQRQLAAVQAVGPAVVVALHHRLTAVLGSFTHRLARLDGLVLEINGADGGVHGTQEEEQIWTAAGSWTGDINASGVITFTAALDPSSSWIKPTELSTKLQRWF